MISGKWVPRDCFLKSSPVSIRSWKVLGRVGQWSVQQNILSDRISKGLVIGKCDASYCSLWQSPKIMNLSRVHKDLLLFFQLWIFLNLSWSNFHFQHIYTALRVNYVYFYIKQKFILFVKNSSFFQAMVALPIACESLLLLRLSHLPKMRCPVFIYVYMRIFLINLTWSSKIVFAVRGRTWDI